MGDDVHAGGTAARQRSSQACATSASQCGASSASRDARVPASHFGAGESNIRTSLTPGTFGEAMYAPEISGRADAAVIVVR